MFVFSCRHALVSQFGSWCQLIGMSLNLCVALFGWWCPAFRIYLLMVCLHYLPACLGLPSSLDRFFYLSPLICLAACLVLLPGSPLFPCLASGVRLFGWLFLVFACLASWFSHHVPYLIASGKPAGHREVAPREFWCEFWSRWKPAREQKRKEGEEEE